MPKFVMLLSPMRIQCCFFAFLIGVPWASSQAQERLSLGTGLNIKKIADNDLVPDCSSLATDWNDSIVVSGSGYIRRLVDEDGDGVADRTQELFSNLRHAAQGLYFEQPYMYFVANNGVWRLDLDAKSGDPERLLEIKTGGEHHTHALRRGTDGLWYLMIGNGVNLAGLQNVETTKIPIPRAGVILQISEDWKQRRVWAHGFRNAYDFDFGSDNTIHTFDSDGEREVSLPWYRPTRVYSVAEGDDAGWVTRNWKRPNYDPAMPEVLAEFGRGSPTGVIRYHDGCLPSRFHDSTIVLDWTFGRVLAVDGVGRCEVLVEPAGTDGFAVTDLDRLSDGRIAISVGGRRSRGGVYLLAPSENEPQTSNSMSSVWKYEKQDLELNREAKNSYAQLLDAKEGAAIQVAFQMLESQKGTADCLAAMRYFIDLQGGLGASGKTDTRSPHQRAAVFDGYRARYALGDAVLKRLENALISLLRDTSFAGPVHEEAIRGLAILGSDSAASHSVLLDELDKTSEPSRRLHRLIALARLEKRWEPSQRDKICTALVEIPQAISESDRKVDRNWTPRLIECLLALQATNPIIGQELVRRPQFGHPSHFVWLGALDGNSREAAASRWMSNQAARGDRAIASFLLQNASSWGTDTLVQWRAELLDSPETEAIAWQLILRDPKKGHLTELRRAAASWDKKLSQRANEAIFRLTGKRELHQPPSASRNYWLTQLSTIKSIDSDAARGKSIFAARQCARCHDSAQALGPSLQGISKRFGTKDLLLATVDPNEAIPDRYRGVRVLTVDGKVIRGLKVYDSVDGLTLQTPEGETKRINAEDILRQQPATQSLMPTGLLDGATTRDVADLISYLKSL
ncbi:MAG: hypothetical protein VXZ82_08370 [Planctomycetota bacterium]|nr:hypothetical protein [Planctomycetota bacterium]